MNPFTWRCQLARQLRWAFALEWAALCASPVLAQSTPDAAASVALPYRSVFEGYQRFSDQAIASWPQTNATVETIGGWRAYAKEAQQTDGPKGTEAAPVPDQKSGGHGGHGKKP